MIVSLAKSYAIDKIKTTFDIIEEIASFFNKSRKRNAQ